MQNFETLYIFLMAFAIIILYSIREVVEQEFHRSRSWFENTLVVGSRGIMGGLIVIISYDALIELNLTLHIVGMEILVKDKVAIFISTIAMLFSDDLIFRTKRKIRGE